MSRPDAVIYADVPMLLQVAEHITGDPQADDLGILPAAVARHRSEAMRREIYGSIWLKAAALLHTLARLPALEHSNGQFGWLAAVAFLRVNGHTLTYEPKDAAILVRDVIAGEAPVRQIALQLRQWDTA
ncbi:MULTISPECIES: fic family toxin-antitoxin system, toxin component [unclassified Streptomyces]|uniref:fic family toxin-antitoxin system, toxin component n=1 Tax=unclassified Streptomyces TaxID=2593676 RepID=UPI0038062842